jgi:xanthine/uracil permease
MEDLIEKLMNDPKMLAGAVVLVVLMIFSAFKKMMKLLIVVVVLIVGLLAYMIQTDQGIDEVIDEGKAKMEELKGKAEDIEKDLEKKFKKINS